MFSKVLIANRGEIAVRVIRACRELGIQTVAVYSEADKDALHAEMADEAICIGPAKASDSYLNVQQILSAAIVTKAEAIHPGFGFLSENSRFAAMCEECNITFIGPKSETIDAMGNKINARQLMIEAEVPVIPGSEGDLKDVTEALAIADEIGYPVMLKAAAGGGGKGIRKVMTKEELPQHFKSAQQEAKAAFGNDAMYLEKIIYPARHIEVQILGDDYGNVIHLGERDCSLQRNNQKVLEEAPSVVISEQKREALGSAAVRAAKAVNYRNAGTIEFLMDETGSFYFMEMNTRIQVEHTVTEMVTGIDLVKAQVKVASGENLPFNQNDIQINGSAIECRINAEDPSKNFMPQVGKVRYLYFPVGNLGMRIDSDLYAGWEITPFYDSMIAKVISLGQDRHEAIEKVKRLLSEMLITGVKTNQSFYLDILKDKNFLDGKVTTEYLEQNFLPKWKEEHKDAAI